MTAVRSYLIRRADLDKFGAANMRRCGDAAHQATLNQGAVVGSIPGEPSRRAACPLPNPARRTHREQSVTEMLPRLPPMRSTTGPKSTVCEVQRWTTTTVKEAQAAKERFVRDSSQSGGAKPGDPEDERCEVFRWVAASVDEVLKLRIREPGLRLRCVECKMPVRVHRALLPTGSPAPHFEHYAGNPQCSRSDG